MAIEDLTSWTHNSALGTGTVNSTRYTVTNAESFNDTENIQKSFGTWAGDFGPFSLDYIQRTGTLLNANNSVLIISDTTGDRASLEAGGKAYIGLQSFTSATTNQRFTLFQYNGAGFDQISGNLTFNKDTTYSITIQRTSSTIQAQFYTGSSLFGTLTITPTVRTYNNASIGIYGNLSIANRNMYSDWSNVDFGVAAAGVAINRSRLVNEGINAGLTRGGYANN